MTYFLGHEFHDVVFEVSRNNTVFFEQYGFYKGPAVTGEVVEVSNDQVSLVRFVKLRITEGSRNSLQVCEIQIFAV